MQSVGKLVVLLICGLLLAAAPPAEDVDVAALIGAATQGESQRSILASLKKIKPKVAVPVCMELLNDRDERVRRVAALALGAYRSKVSLDALTNLLGDIDPTVVAAAAHSIMKIRGNAGLDLVSGLLGHPSVRVRCSTAALLGKVGRQAGTAALKARLGTAKMAEERSCLLRAITRGDRRFAATTSVALLEQQDTRELGVAVLVLVPREALVAMAASLVKPTDEEFIAATMGVAGLLGDAGTRWMARRIDSRHASVRQAALDILLSRIGETLVKSLLIKAASTGQITIRARVIDALADEKARALAPLVRAWLVGQPFAVRAAAARALRFVGSKADVSRLLRTYLNERDQSSQENLPVRVELLKTMGTLKQVDWVPVFVDAVGVEGEQSVATDALVAIGPPAVRTLLLVVKVGDSRRIPFAVEALARIGEGVGEAAGGLFKHPLESIRVLGRDLMAASGDPEAVASLLTLLRGNEVDDPVPLVEAIATFGTVEAQTGLIEASQHENELVRMAAIKGLGASQLNNNNVAEALTTVIENDTSEAVRAQAIRSMFRLGCKGMVDLLIRVIQFDSRNVRIEAYEALGWAGDPRAIPALASRIRDAVEKDEKTRLKTALQRITRRGDLTSMRTYKRWHSAFKRAIGPRAEGARRAKIKRGNRTIHYRTAGRGKAIVAVSGYHGGDSWIPVLDRLAGGRRVVTYDARGRGRSPLGSAEFSYKDEVSDLEYLRRHLKIGRMVLVAHDVGGLVAVAYARTYPKRVSKIVLVSTPARASNYGLDAVAQRRLKGVWAKDLSSLDARHAWFHPTAWLAYRNAALAPGYVLKAHLAPRVSAFPVLPFVRQQVSKALSRLELTSLVTGTKIPVLLVAGVNAPLRSKDSAALAHLSKKNKRIRLVRLKGVNHYPHLEVPTQMAQIISNFLKP
ncbi:MAG TPA: alpha/beta fold hydrolase [Myxococcales bacterium]|nr:alpha/beta fold hydrolase [Myxococcales bacterium]HIN86614.1 alpha/beta fold hydrolase [Myxococcales bacterium]